MKTHQMFSSHTTEEFKKATITGYFGFTFDYRDDITFEKLCFQNGFHLHENQNPASSNSSCLKSFFGKLRFRD